MPKFRSLTHSPKAISYLITNGRLTDANYPNQAEPAINVIRKAAKHGINLIQIREKRLSGKNLFDYVCRVLSAIDGGGARLLVNDRFDIALAAGADGVHLTSKSIDTGVVRGSMPQGCLIGVSCHSAGEVREAQKAGADFAVFGPVFASTSKPGARPTGIKKLQHLCRGLDGFPVIGLGGINKGNIDLILDSGASGFAGISIFSDDSAFQHPIFEATK